MNYKILLIDYKTKLLFYHPSSYVQSYKKIKNEKFTLLIFLSTVIIKSKNYQLMQERKKEGTKKKKKRNDR